MKWVGVISVSAIMFCAAAGTTFAYALPTSTSVTPATGSIDLSQLSSSTLNTDWGVFFNGLPVQDFVKSLQSASKSVTGVSVQNIVPPNLTSAVGQDVLTQIDDWTATHLGFRFSTAAQAILGILSWVLAAAKNVVDWLLGFLK